MHDGQRQPLPPSRQARWHGGSGLTEWLPFNYRSPPIRIAVVSNPGTTLDPFAETSCLKEPLWVSPFWAAGCQTQDMAPASGQEPLHICAGWAAAARARIRYPRRTRPARGVPARIGAHHRRFLPILFSRSAKPSSQFLSLVDGTVVHKADGDWAACNSSRHALAEVQRRASLQCGIDRVAIDLARFGGHLVA
jgi:hypothetical protein